MARFTARLIASYVLCMLFLIAVAVVGITGAQSAASAADTAQATADSTARVLVGMLVVGGLIAVGCAWWLVRQLVLPLRELSGLLDAAATGDLTGRGTWLARDECGAIVRAYNTMADELSGMLRTVAVDAKGLTAAAEELTLFSGDLGAGATESATQAGVVAAAAAQVSANVRNVAAATEEVNASIREIAVSTSAAAGVATDAVEAVATANSTITQLGASSGEIGSVVKVITSIAEQTNLLALNATIEAARAGDAGKGFAVVAGEVKELARETSAATEDIGRRIKAIQADSRAAASAIDTIAAIIDQINDTQAAIATALEEQTATTNEMSRSVAEAATGSDEIAVNVGGVASAAASSSRRVADSLDASANLTRMSLELTETVDRFTFTADAREPAPREQVVAAIAAHGAWKRRLADAVAAGSHTEDVSVVGRDDRCAFGAWLSTTDPAPEVREHYATGRRLHADFHREAAAVLRLVGAGRLDAASDAIAQHGAFAETSRALTGAMIAWRGALQGD